MSTCCLETSSQTEHQSDESSFLPAPLYVFVHLFRRFISCVCSRLSCFQA